MRIKSTSCLINVGIFAKKKNPVFYGHVIRSLMRSFCSFVYPSLSRGTEQLCIPVKYKNLAVHTKK